MTQQHDDDVLQAVPPLDATIVAHDNNNNDNMEPVPPCSMSHNDDDDMPWAMPLKQLSKLFGKDMLLILAKGV